MNPTGKKIENYNNVIFKLATSVNLIDSFTTSLVSESLLYVVMCNLDLFDLVPRLVIFSFYTFIVYSSQDKQKRIKEMNLIEF